MACGAWTTTSSFLLCGGLRRCARWVGGQGAGGCGSRAPRLHPQREALRAIPPRPPPQLVRHPFIRPSSIHDEEVLSSYSQDFLYLGCVRFVKQASGAGGRAGRR